MLVVTPIKYKTTELVCNKVLFHLNLIVIVKFPLLVPFKSSLKPIISNIYSNMPGVVLRVLHIVFIFCSGEKNPSSKINWSNFIGEITKAENVKSDLQSSHGKYFVDPKF